MAEINTAGYQDLRDYITTNWLALELRDTGGTAVLKVDTSDSRLSWTDVDNDAFVTLKITVKGSDADVPTPTTFGASAVYETTASAAELTSETFADATVQDDDDTLTVEHTIEVPQQP